MVTRRPPQSILAEVSATLASSLAAEDILATVARQIGEAMGVFSCDIWEYEPGARHMTFVATWCAAEKNPYGDAVGDTAELDDWDNMLAVVEGRRTVELHSDDPDLPPIDRASFDKWGFQTTIDTPLVYGDRVIGVLGLVETRALRRFTPAERTLFGQLAVQAAIAINNAHAFRRLEEQNRHLGTLADAGRALTSPVDIVGTLGVMTAKAASALGASRCTVYAYDRSSDSLVRRASHESGAKKVRRPAGVIALADHPCEQAVVREGVIAADKVPDPAPVAGMRSCKLQPGEKSRLEIPLVFKGQALGMIVLAETCVERRYSKTEIDLVCAVGELTAAAMENAKLYALLESEAITDGLTGLYNHRFFYRRLREEVARSRRYGSSLSLLMVDIDDFKRFNDRHGHQTGDQALRAVAQLLQTHLRCDIDIPARYGGEEFAIILPDTPIDGGRECGSRLVHEASRLLPQVAESRPGPGPTTDGAAGVGERIRKEIEETTRLRSAELGMPERITVSVGVSASPPLFVDAEGLVSAADAAMYDAKRRGKNQVVVCEF